jgi:hypothetical protein
VNDVLVGDVVCALSTISGDSTPSNISCHHHNRNLGCRSAAAAVAGDPRASDRHHGYLCPRNWERQNPGGVACPRATRDRSGVFVLYVSPVPANPPTAVELARRLRLAARQERLGRPLSWLDDAETRLDARGHVDIVKARRRVRAKKKPPTDGQIISELGFGFWRFLVARRYQAEPWPDLASGFRYAPNRARRTLEDPIVRLHEFRNRLAHHQRIWSEPVEQRYQDCLLIAGFIDPIVRDWVAATSRVPVVLARRPS